MVQLCKIYNTLVAVLGERNRSFCVALAPSNRSQHTELEYTGWESQALGASGLLHMFLTAVPSERRATIAHFVVRPLF